MGSEPPTFTALYESHKMLFFEPSLLIVDINDLPNISTNINIQMYTSV